MRKHQFLAILGATLLFAGCAGNDRIEPNLPDFCPDDPDKQVPGICGCGVPDVDLDENEIIDCIDAKLDFCPDDPNKTEPGKCGCGKEDVDTDNDGTLDCMDLCPKDAAKTEPGYCDCGNKDEDKNGNNIPDCIEDNADQCEHVEGRIDGKTTPGICGCDKDDELDADQDGTPDCKDMCPENDKKTEPGKYGCECEDVDDNDGDKVPNCLDDCPDNPSKTSAGICGCDKEDSVENLADDDGDGVINCLDACPSNPTKSDSKYTNNCDDNDSDGDGVDDASDKCPYNPNKTSQDKNGCNYDEKNNVFEIWNAEDLEELKTLLNDRINPSSGAHFLCKYDSNVKYSCYDDTHAKACVLENQHYTLVDITCGSCQNGTCSKVENNEPVKLYNACSYEDSDKLNRCDTTYLYQCKKIDEKIGFVEKITQCSYSIGGSCQDGVCKGNTDQPPVQSGNSYGYRCSNYTQSCDSKDEVGKLRTCFGDVIVPEKCLEPCSLPSEAGGTHPICIITEPVESPNLKIRLMKDIDLGIIVPKVKNVATCYGDDWEPINLNQVEFDGGGFAITYHIDNETCNMVQPLFGSVYNSTIKNLNIKYDFRGKSSSVFANLIFRSIVDNVSYSGTVEYDKNYGTIAEGISTPYFGIIASYADRSKFNKINISGKIYYSNGNVASMIGKGYDFVVADSNVKLDKFYCGGSNCFGLAGNNISSKSVYDTVSVNINEFQTTGSSYGISMFSSDMYNVNLNIDNLDVGGNWFSLFNSQSGSDSKEMVNVRVHLNNVVAKNNFYAAWNSASPITATNVAIRNDNVFMPSGNYVPISSLTNSVLTDFAIYSNVTLQDTATISTRFAQSSNTNTKLERVVNSTRVFRKESETVTNEITDGPAISGSALTALKVFYRAEIDGIAASTTTIDGVSSFKNTETSKTVSALNEESETKLWVESEFNENGKNVKLPWLKSM